MTDERKNEIWAMLDSQCQNIAKDCYLMGNPKVAWAIEQFFGTHNLTAQAEEKPKFKVSDKVSYFGQVATIFKAHCNGYDVIFGNGATLYNLPEATLDPYIEPNGKSDDKSKPSQANPLDVAKSVEPSTKKDTYFAYRLDLAKEIAVAMIKCECDWDVSNCAVSYANEIVKRLKETEE